MPNKITSTNPKEETKTAPLVSSPIAGISLAVAASLFLVAWLLMPSPGVTDAEIILALVAPQREAVVASVIASYITAEAQYGYQALPILMIAKDGVIVVDEDESKIRFSMEDVHTDAETGKPVANITRYEYAAGDDVYTMTFKRQKTILRNKLIETLPQDKQAAAAAAGFDVVYVRFTGDFTFTHYRQDAPVAEMTEPAMWELMYFGHTRQPNA